MFVMLILVSLMFAGLSVYCFCKANYCACNKAGQCDNPINLFWLGTILAALVSLAFSCFALHTEQGTILWLIMMTSCQLGAVLSAKWQALTGSETPKLKDETLTGGIN